MSTAAFWSEPTATDVSGTATLQSRSHAPGDQFNLGATQVMYIFSDASGNIETCLFTIIVNAGMY